VGAKRYSKEAIAAILAEGTLGSVEETCKKWGITVRTWRNYRSLLGQDSEIASLFLLKKRILVSDWQQDATEALKVTLQEIKKRSRTCSTEEEAKCLHAIVGACKIVGELSLTAKAIMEENGDLSDSGEN
jgi:hypothetical protein